jgi:hypothetical protein
MKARRDVAYSETETPRLLVMTVRERDTGTTVHDVFVARFSHVFAVPTLP